MSSPLFMHLLSKAHWIRLLLLVKSGQTILHLSVLFFGFMLPFQFIPSLDKIFIPLIVQSYWLGTIPFYGIFAYIDPNSQCRLLRHNLLPILFPVQAPTSVHMQKFVLCDVLNSCSLVNHCFIRKKYPKAVIQILMPALSELLMISITFAVAIKQHKVFAGTLGTELRDNRMQLC